ncbi:MAG: hypothetical protein KAH84_06360 [Thiomargarita sp.]|nr:hypothetical protein [Thiomargarita sp.]
MSKKYLFIVYYSLVQAILFISIPTCLAETTEQISLAEIKSGQVVLPWQELKKLLEEIQTLKKDIAKFEQLQAKNKKNKPELLPVDYSIIESQFEGDVKGLSANFRAKFSVQILKDGWVKIPFFANTVGISSIKIYEQNSNATVTSVNLQLENKQNNKQRAQFLRDKDGYYLLTKGYHALNIEANLYAPIQVNELNYSFAFTPPRAVINRIRLAINEKGVNVIDKTVHTYLIQAENGGTIIETILSEHEKLKLGWKIEKDSGTNRKSEAILYTLSSINKSNIIIHNTAILSYLNSFEQVTFSVPLNVEILDVSSVDIEQWTIEKWENTQLIKIIGQSKPRTITKVDISYQLKYASLPAEKIKLPSMKIIGTDTIEGFMGVEVLGNLEITTIGITDGMQMLAKDLPKILWKKSTKPLLYGYQFSSPLFSSTFNIKGYEEIETVVANVDLIDSTTHRTLEGKSITRILYHIRNNDRQFLELILPPKSRLWQAFLDGRPIKPAQKDTGEILIPMKKSNGQGVELETFVIEIGYITEVNKLSLKGDILNQLPTIDIPISYLRWNLYLPEYYQYSKFEGLLKQVTNFSNNLQNQYTIKSQIDIPTQGQKFLFEKYLIIEEQPYIRGKYGQFLGNDIFLSLHPDNNSYLQPQQIQTNLKPLTEENLSTSSKIRPEQVTPNW